MAKKHGQKAYGEEGGRYVTAIMNKSKMKEMNEGRKLLVDMGLKGEKVELEVVCEGDEIIEKEGKKNQTE